MVDGYEKRCRITKPTGEMGEGGEQRRGRRGRRGREEDGDMKASSGLVVHPGWVVRLVIGLRVK